ncbi:hypothetical protein BX616_005142 [Lobosporangium transversale]|uniref:FAD-binding FR-type domain-containing protein n=1 Tax=Lobosporangium transversale TaxID=64571 RepID=A0A1Y2G822_9FUNG|nr:hypothetical protein BCR41DRAFT_363225 [Lobosporangium transversale]KAF9897690.1 hypothetical protein BX616_005142 [Lobosporangium transversale]ORZ02034.1 hypothetical protein BCR41DRAFT_363225 [Lobosporangium transversale]|eukprot:XP_021876262.1 hypothetical protein BCR41DRAFT_363225 [Lobosporangium transversale]
MNPTVAKWLEEIAAAKAKVQAKSVSATSHIALPNNSATAAAAAATIIEGTPHKAMTVTETTNYNNSTNKTIATRPSYGIILSYDLKTRKKKLRLVLPPEPIKPAPGECCGNDCDPCVNTIYWEDLAAYKEQVKKLEVEYKEACQSLELGQTEEKAVVTQMEGIQYANLVENNNNDADDEGLSIRSYRPFKVLRKCYLTKNTLLVVCDLPYSLVAAAASTTSPTGVSESNNKNRTPDYQYDSHIKAMFHVLIRFKRELRGNKDNHNSDNDIGNTNKDEEFITRAYTPVDLSNSSFLMGIMESGENSDNNNSNSVSSLQDKMGFLVKLYPAPHSTSDMFRQLKEYNHKDHDVVSDKSNQSGWLYLRGPIQTARDRQRNHQAIVGETRIELGIEPESVSETESINSDLRKGIMRKNKKKKERIVMIAAGSGITPMYQVIRAVHQSQQQQQQQQLSDHIPSETKLDLIYCNRASSDIWLRQEIQKTCFLSTSWDKNDSNAVMKTQRVHIQHVLSQATSIAMTTAMLHHQKEQEGQGQEQKSDHHHYDERIHTGGRITLEILRNTLQDHSPSTSTPISTATTSSDSDDTYLKFLICGPPAFNLDVSSMLAQLGYTESNTCEIHVLE